MTTTIVPPASAPEESSLDVGPLIDVYANLLPPEIVAGRRLAELKRRLMIGLAALVAVLMLVFVFSWWQTHHANSTLASQKSHTSTLQSRLRGFQPLIAAQAQSAQIQSSLKSLMVDDLQWRDLIAQARKAATGVASINAIQGNISGIAGTPGQTAPPGALANLPVLNQSGQQAIGTLSISGTATDKNSIAKYVDLLGAIHGLAAPFPASLTGKPGSFTFTVDVLITTDALGGRYSTAAGTQGGH